MNKHLDSRGGKPAGTVCPIGRFVNVWDNAGMHAFSHVEDMRTGQCVSSRKAKADIFDYHARDELPKKPTNALLFAKFSGCPPILAACHQVRLEVEVVGPE